MKKANPVLFTILVCAAWVIAGPQPAPDEIQWLESYPAAIREAKRTQKPIFLEFRCEP